MSGAKDGGPAFPSPGVVLPGNDGTPFQQGAYEGMTLLDYYAGEAMKVMDWHNRDDCYDNHADRCFSIALCMVKARERAVGETS